MYIGGMTGITMCRRPITQKWVVRELERRCPPLGRKLPNRVHSIFSEGDINYGIILHPKKNYKGHCGLLNSKIQRENAQKKKSVKRKMQKMITGECDRGVEISRVRSSRKNVALIIGLRVRKVKVRAEHWLAVQISLVDNSVNMQEELRISFREVCEKAFGHWSKMPLHVVGKVLIVVFLFTHQS
jgi:hypothetical protein